MREVSASIAGADPGSSPPRTTIASLADITLRRVLVVQLTMTEQRYRAVHRDEGPAGLADPQVTAGSGFWAPTTSRVEGWLCRPVAMPGRGTTGRRPGPPCPTAGRNAAGRRRSRS